MYAPAPGLALASLLLAGCSETFLNAEEKAPVPVDSGLDTGDTGGDTSGDTSDTPDDTSDTGPDEPGDADGDGVPASHDCDDTDATVFPGAQELWYDGVDQDCDGNDDDQDLDGSPYPTDCDDTDAAVLPGAVETWYDGIDQDCDGNDDDQDADGSPYGTDCDDLDAGRAPGAAETWYDGVDQDCDGNDNDQDADGVDVRSDCDDTDAAVYPGAPETWYDGVDQACDGGSDYDQDGDGDSTTAGGGTDCDDTDAAAFTGGHETLGDASDGDCDGGDDTFGFTTLDTFSGTGLQGPRIAEVTGFLIVTFLADTLTYGASAMTTGAGIHFLDSSDPWSGSVADSAWEWGSTYTFDDGVDLWANDDLWVWTYGLHTGSTRYLVADAYNTIVSGWGTTVYSRSTGATYDDVEVVEAADGTLHFVGCENGSGYLTWMHGSASDVYTATMDGSDDVSGASGDACIVDTADKWLLVSQRSSSRIWIGSYNDTSGISSYGTSSPWNVYDMEIDVTTGLSAWAAAEGTSGLWVALDGAEITLPLSDVRQVDIAVDPSGVLYAAVIDTGNTVYLYWGDPTSGFTRVQLDTGLVAADDVDVHLTSAGQVIVAVRNDNDVSYGAVNAI